MTQGDVWGSPPSDRVASVVGRRASATQLRKPPLYLAEGGKEYGARLTLSWTSVGSRPTLRHSHARSSQSTGCGILPEQGQHAIPETNATHLPISFKFLRP